MRITTISLRNYRVFSALDLEIPPGLVGIHGPNGAGKSSLLESITWALYGRARTSKHEIRTSGVTGECLVEIGFEHDDHHYLVRRTISGVNATVKARVEVSGAVVADGPQEVGRFLRSVLGMDEAAFRSSVFAEQKQLAAFSDQSPEVRRKLVLQLLGITPLDKARDLSRAEARAKRTDYDRVVGLLPALDELDVAVEESEIALRHAEKTESEMSAILAKSREEDRLAREAVDAHKDAKRAYDLVVERGRSVRGVLDGAQAELARLHEQVVAVRAAGEQLAALQLRKREFGPEQLAVAEERVRLIRALRELDRARSQLPIPLEVVEVDPAPLERARAAASAATAERSELDGERRAAEKTVAAATQSRERLDTIAGEEECPLCGQELADGLDAVRAHRELELNQARADLKSLLASVAAATTQEKKATTALRDAEKEFVLAQKRAEDARVARAHHERLEAERTSLLDALGGEPNEGESEQLQHLLAEARALDVEIGRVEVAAGRLAELERLIEDVQARRDEAETQRALLLEEHRAIRFDATTFATATSLAQQCADTLKQQEAATRAVELELARSQQRHASAAQRRDDARTQHAQMHSLAEEARYLARTSDFLGGFRQSVVSIIGPRLSADAGALFNELTAGEYDGIEVDPETYEIKIIDAGVSYPSSRFSGSEVDLANLALRVAISEQVRFQAGGQVGLLVLDEALASLDGERKDRMLAALTRLSGRFRQILVVTHAPEVKERLPVAIEVRKQPGRRAHAVTLDLPVG